MAEERVDRDRLEAFHKLVGDQVAAGFNCSLSSLGDRLGLYRAVKRDRAHDQRGAGGPHRAARTLAAGMAPAPGMRRAAGVRGRALLTQPRRGGGPRPGRASVLLRQRLRCGHRHVPGDTEAARGLPHRPGPRLRRTRAGVRLRHRAHVRLDAAQGTGAETAARPARRRGQARAGGRGGRRGLRVGHRAARHGGGVSGLHVRRLRHLEARPRARRPGTVRRPVRRTSAWRTRRKSRCPTGRRSTWSRHSMSSTTRRTRRICCAPSGGR